NFTNPLFCMLVLNLLFYVLINSYFFKVANIEFFSQTNGVKKKYLVFYTVKRQYLGFLLPKHSYSQEI
ncbi:MAG: hypothetical protein IKW43_09950, partial [Bacteroidaceae bacterium]|nr:hypothetical protein [Bacteroidaceae bacterium]